MKVQQLESKRYSASIFCSALLFLSGCSAPGEEVPENSDVPAVVTPDVSDPGLESVVTTQTASRFLNQATFGSTATEIERLQSIGFSAWLQSEFSKPQESLLQEVLIAEAAGENIGGDQLSETFWTRAILSDDQLRQRVGYALSQIIVASYRDPQLENRPVAMANYMDIMAAGAFGNFRQLLENVTYSPTMAIYLTYLQNQKADAEREVVPDENYAREVMQLFTIGLLELQDNGELRLDGGGQPIETYDNTDVTEIAKVFTGLSWAGRENFLGKPSETSSEYMPLVMFDEEHSAEAKNFLGTSIPPNMDGNQSIAIALDTLFNHANTPAFISKQLIQRLVTSNPSPDYVLRVANAFREGTFNMPNGQNAGNGQRGDMRAVVAAILLDPEARDASQMTVASFGKVREPVIRFTHWARAFGVQRTRVDAINSLQDTTSPARLNQQAYRSSSVFNFYRPGFVSPGSESAAAGLVAPELQITTASSVTGYTNFMEGFITRDSAEQDFSADYADELRIADDATSLVNHLDDLLTYGSLSSQTRARTIQAINAITSGDNGFTRDEVRVHVAVLLIMTSSDYIIAR